MNYHVLTLFPDMVLNGLNTSIIGRAVESGKISVNAIDIREFTLDKHRKVDDYPYGGGAGMLMQAQPVYDAYKSVADKLPEKSKRRVVYVTPQGYPFTQHMAEKFAKCDDLILLCGHYEGIDERVIEEIVDEEISIGDFVLTGGELPALVVADAVCRMLPGVLSDDICFTEESHFSGLLEYPQYTKPAVWMGRQVPEVLLSGHHANIEKWRREQSLKITNERRPDILKLDNLDKKDLKYIEQLKSDKHDI